MMQWLRALFMILMARMISNKEVGKGLICWWSKKLIFINETVEPDFSLQETTGDIKPDFLAQSIRVQWRRRQPIGQLSLGSENGFNLGNCYACAALKIDYELGNGTECTFVCMPHTKKHVVTYTGCATADRLTACACMNENLCNKEECSNEGFRAMGPPELINDTDGGGSHPQSIIDTTAVLVIGTVFVYQFGVVTFCER